jgi:excisionase family DNA binding protein
MPRHWSNKDNTEYLNGTQAARFLGLTKSAIYMAISIGRIKSKKIGADHFIHIDDLKAYQESRYKRQWPPGLIMKAEFRDTCDREFVNNTLGYTRQHINRLIKSKRLPARRENGSLIFDKPSVMRYRKIIDDAIEEYKKDPRYKDRYIERKRG